MAKWRALDAYSPFARTLVDYMWTQRPPLLPNQFAERMGVRKQALSTWLNSDAVPAPPVVVRLARAMGLPVRQLMTAAGYAPADDPLLDAADAWAYVRSEVEHAERAADVAGAAGEAGVEASGLAAATPEAYAALLRLLHQLQERTRAEAGVARARLQGATSLSADSADAAGALHASAQTDDPADRPSVPTGDRLEA